MHQSSTYPEASQIYQTEDVFIERYQSRPNTNDAIKFLIAVDSSITALVYEGLHSLA